MANSDSTITRQNLIKRAFRRIGIDTPSPSKQALAVPLLNAIVKELDTEGRWLWTVSNSESSLTISSGTRSYVTGSTATTIATNILALERVDLYIGTSYTPLDIIDKSESISSHLREGTGQPVACFLEVAPVMTSQKLHFFQTPDATYTVKYSYRRRLYDFDNASDNPDFPQDWEQRLVKGLASELAPEYGLPLVEQEKLKRDWEEEKRKGLAANAEVVSPTRQRGVYF